MQHRSSLAWTAVRNLFSSDVLSGWCVDRTLSASLAEQCPVRSPQDAQVNGQHEHPRHFGILSRQSSLPVARRKDRRRGAGRAFHTEEGRCLVSHTSHRVLPSGGWDKAADLAFVGFCDKPLLKFERILEFYRAVAH